MNNETQLLQTVSAIADKFEMDIRQNGELFNVYSLLNIEHRENETHSILLADLLSPDGTHGQGKLFLDLFVETLTGETNLFNENVKVHREYSIGKINEDYTEGGRIDILITDGKTTWIIENKIYAKDQENQLERYRASDKKATIIYLKPASHEKYKGDPKLVNHDISYEVEITEWLEKIINSLEHKEYLKNSIKQYYNLVQNISFTGYTQKMNTELQNTITNSEANIEAAFKIKEQFDKVIFELYKDAYDKNITSYIESKEYEVIEDSYSNFTYTKENWKQNKLAISFRFNKDNFKDLYIGIYKLEELDEDILNQLKTKTNELIESSLNWPLYNYPFGKQSLYDLEIAKKLQNGEFQKLIIAELENYAKILDEIIA